MAEMDNNKVSFNVENQELSVEYERQNAAVKEEEVDSGSRLSGYLPVDDILFDAQKQNSQIGLAERMASRLGFSSLTINTPSFRLDNLASAPSNVQSPYLTIPPGLSPTTLFDSSVLLPNMVQPSPTSGKMLFDWCSNVNSMPNSIFPERRGSNALEVSSEPFALRPHPDSSTSYVSSMANIDGWTAYHQNSLSSLEATVHSQYPICGERHEAVTISMENKDVTRPTGFCDLPERTVLADVILDEKTPDTLIGSEHSLPLDDSHEDVEVNLKCESSSAGTGVVGEDGYNWRKYGQKQVKGSEYPRSYYKCTHTTCLVKKKVERSPEGHVTEIIYSGAHNHPKPCRRSSFPTQLMDMPLDGSEPENFVAATDVKPLCTNSQRTNGPAWQKNVLGATGASTLPELCDPSLSLNAQNDGGPRLGSPDAGMDALPNVSNDDDEDDGVTHGSFSVFCDEDEAESKRRKLDTSLIEANLTARGREPKVVVQTTSEVDILDDGYRWRKYGQKVVKGNPNPRSYYKCTHPGCIVRKHVERASHDLKAVITTYEGKHNHDVPAARNSGSGHSSSGSSSTSTPLAPLHPHGLPRIPVPIQGHDNAMRFGVPNPLGLLGLPGDHMLPYGIGQQSLSGLGIGGIGPVAPLKMEINNPQFLAYLSHHRPAAGTMGYIMPKGEPNEPAPEIGLQPSISNGAAAAIAYRQIMSRLAPL